MWARGARTVQHCVFWIVWRAESQSETVHSSAETSDVAGRSPSMPEDPILRAVLLMAVAVAVALTAAGEAAAWLRGG